MKPAVRRLCLIWLAWTAAGLFYATQDVMLRAYRSEAVPWLPLFGGWMLSMYICAAFTPTILWLGRRWPLERGRRLARVLLHLLFSAVFSVVSAAIEAPLLQAFGIFPAPQMTLLAAVSLLLAHGFHGGMIRYWAVLGLQTVFRMHQAAKDREHEALQLAVRSSTLSQQLTAAQLGALKMQLQPHFLFNTLGAIMVLTQQGKTREAAAMLGRLSDLLHLTLEDVDAQEVTLGRELDFLRIYLSIEQARFEDRLRVEIRSVGELDGALVPHMVLQPLVENAVRHGLGRSEDPVLIEVATQRSGSQLTITVTDDGPGNPSASFEGAGIGLANIRNRLKYLYGERAVLHATNISPHGVCVTMLLPFHTELSESVDDESEDSHSGR
jgi:signal transduction histidine kinase